MNKLEICLTDILPITLNHSTKYRAAGKFVKAYKSAEYKQIESIINSQLNSYKSDIRKFNQKYCDQKYIRASYRFYYPIFTKKKTISKTSKDIDNIVKPINDIIFKHLDCDDSQVIELNVIKIQSEKPRIEISFRLEDLKLIL